MRVSLSCLASLLAATASAAPAPTPKAASSGIIQKRAPDCTVELQQSIVSLGRMRVVMVGANSKVTELDTDVIGGGCIAGGYNCPMYFTTPNGKTGQYEYTETACDIDGQRSPNCNPWISWDGTPIYDKVSSGIWGKNTGKLGTYQYDTFDARGKGFIDGC